MPSRVTFHNAAPPGPLVSALIDKRMGHDVTVERQNFLHKGNIAVKYADARSSEKAAFRAALGIHDDGYSHEDFHGWIFRRDKMEEKLLALKQTFEDEWDRNHPDRLTIMGDLEPHRDDPGSSRIAVMNDAICLVNYVLGQRVQFGFYGLPLHHNLNNPANPPNRMYDSVIANQGAIFIHAGFSSRNHAWFERGMALARTLIQRIAPIRDDRPVICLIWARTRIRADFKIIPDHLQQKLIRLLLGANIELCVFGDIDHETAHVIELILSEMTGGT